MRCRNGTVVARLGDRRHPRGHTCSEDEGRRGAGLPAYLQDVGCQRVRSLWGISLAGINPREDVIEVKLDGPEGGDFWIEVQVRGRCAITDEENSELGGPGSDGFFGPAWEKSKDKPVERERVRSNIRKAAIANGQGRLVRRLTGLGSVPVARLAAIRLDRKRMRGTEFQSGTRVGAATTRASRSSRSWSATRSWAARSVTSTASATSTSSSRSSRERRFRRRRSRRSSSASSPPRRARFL